MTHHNPYLGKCWKLFFAKGSNKIRQLTFTSFLFPFLQEQPGNLQQIWRISHLTVFFSPESSQSEEDFSSGSFVEFLRDLLQHQMGPSDTGLDHESFFDPPRWAAPLREPECAFCHSNTESLKRCSGCKRVFYCSTTRQRNHWKEHKPECQKSWNLNCVYSTIINLLIIASFLIAAETSFTFFSHSLGEWV